MLIGVKLKIHVVNVIKIYFNKTKPISSCLLLNIIKPTSFMAPMTFYEVFIIQAY